MATIKHYKVVAALPSTLVADSIYLVRVGTGFDLYVTNSSGTIVAYPANYQAGSANLSALSGLTGAANKAPYFTAAGAMAVYDLTVFGRSLAAAADAAAGRTLLGLGTAATRAATTSATDTTSERLWRTNDLVKQTSANDATTGRILTLASTAGAFGLGATSANSISNPDAALTLANGMYVAVGNAFADPPYGTDAVYIDHRRGSGSAVQFAQRAQTGAGMKLRLYSGGSWSPWVELWHSGNTLQLGATPASARTAMELGTAALLTATASTTDTTIGRAQKIGDFGIGAMGTTPLADADVTASGLAVYTTGSSTGNAPNSWGTLLNVRGNVSGFGHGFQIAKGNGSSNFYMRGSSGTAPFAWESWQTLWHSGNLDNTESGWLTPTLVNSYAQGTDPVRYRRIGKFVVVTGSLRRFSPPTALQTICTLPAGYRPAKQFTTTVLWVSDNLAMQATSIAISTDGAIVVGILYTLAGTPSGAGGSPFTLIFPVD